MDTLFVPGITPPTDQAQKAWWFIFVGHRLLVNPEDRDRPVPYLAQLSDLDFSPIRTQFFGTYQGSPCYAAELPTDAIAPEGLVLRGLRELYGTVDDLWYSLGGRAVQILDWDRNHQFCGHCATPTIPSNRDRAKRCPKCGLTHYPRISPAMIVLISDGDNILLARAPRFPVGMYSILAGFVEPGESLEDTVIREVREEVGVEITDIRYFGSQPWPFPNSLMIGFTARYAGGEIAIADDEIVEAAWFNKYQLPAIPNKPSIARKLIDWFVAQPSVEGSTPL